VIGIFIYCESRFVSTLRLFCVIYFKIFQNNFKKKFVGIKISINFNKQIKTNTMNARQKRIEKSGYKITWLMNDNHYYKLIAVKGYYSIKATSITNLYNQIFN
jgi:hypothetical protein